MKEFEIRDQIYQFLQKKGIFCWKDRTLVTKPGKGTSIKARGVPDILGWLSDGTFLGIEVKTSEGKLSPQQKDFIARGEKDGCMVFVARSLDDVIQRFP